MRAAVLTIGQGKQLTTLARTELEKLVSGDDSELAVMAKLALRTSN
ncbi:MAG: cytochrome c-type biogenesis protein CcmH/NrfG [Planctomycetota bacterium]